MINDWVQILGHVLHKYNIKGCSNTGVKIGVVQSYRMVIYLNLGR